MRYWWVNQNQTYQAEIPGGYVWSPKRNKNGARNQFYENMRELAPGDLIFSFRDRRIAAVGVVQSHCYEAPQPGEFGAAGKNWEKVGWRGDVTWTECNRSMIPKGHIDRIRPLLPEKYSPLQQDGDGLQSVYLAAIGKALADLLLELLSSAGNTLVLSPAASNQDKADQVKNEREKQLEQIIEQSAIPATEKNQLIKARRGQGKFRDNLQKLEVACRITTIADPRFLIASHIKPWRSASNQERLDGENGLLLAPNIDLLFDRGFISITDEGRLLVSPVADASTLEKLGVPTLPYGVGSFTQRQREFLGFHRREVFLKADGDEA